MRKLLLIIVLAGLLCTSDISEAHGNPASPGRVIPVAGKILRRFQMGESDWSPGHRGVDLAGIEGQQVVSPESGVVSWVGRINGVPMMSIQHPDGTRSTFQPVTTSLATGAVVFAGQPVAILVTGHCDGSDVCLHWGVRRGETYLDPLVWLGGDTPRVRLLSADATPRVTPPFGGTGIMPTGDLPVPGPITSGFGPRTNPISGRQEFHDGVDIGANCGTPVATLWAGIVRRATTVGGFGLRVEVDHGNGLSTSYSHLERIDVSSGQQLTAGSIVGAVGTTGYSTGCHLHYSMVRNDITVDPLGVH